MAHQVLKQKPHIKQVLTTGDIWDRR